MIRMYRHCAVMFLAAIMMPLAAVAAELGKGERDTIFVDALKVQPSVSEMAVKKGTATELKRLADSLAVQLVAALNATHVFQLVEPGRIAAGTEEQKSAGDEAALDEESDKAAEAGRSAGARFAFVPWIDGFEDRSDITEFQAIGRATLKRKVFLSAMVHIVDTATGELLLDSPSVQLNKIEEHENARINQVAGSDEILVTLAREMARKLAQESVALLRPAKVLAVTGRQVLINRGSEAGFSKGDLVEIFAVQNVRDEESGEIFHNEVSVGQAIISRIDRNQSYAGISGDDLGITKGCVVRFLKSAASRAAEREPSPDTTQPDFGLKNDPGATPGSSEKPLKWR